MTRTGIHVYGQSANGGHAVGLDVGGLRVLIQPRGPEEDAAAVALAQAVEHAAGLAAELQRAQAGLRREAARADAAEAALARALEGRRALFGRALLVPELAGDWGGPVWLYDPERRERGMGLRFPSLEALRHAYPELWVAGLLDGGVLLDAAPLPEPEVLP